MNRFLLPALLFVVFSPLCVFTTNTVFAIEPKEILVLANINASQSKGLARFYMEKRQIPQKNLVRLFITDKETCTRDIYEKKVVPPVRRALENLPDIRAIVTIYGLPLRIASPGFTPREQSKIDRLTRQIETLKAMLENDAADDPEARKEIAKQISALNRQIKQARRSTDKVASFDSELMLVKKDAYDLNMWIKNPYFLGWKNQDLPMKKSDVLMVSRLDGATPDIVKRIITDSIEAEKEGLGGTAYFDARWKDPGDKEVSGYSLYDRSIHRASRLISQKTPLKVILNDDRTLFQKGESPNAAFYCGWYSLAKYVDAFTWQKGSVGFHIASSECATLKRNDSQVWCKKMLDYGVAATIGPVGEPYVQSFPLPEIFFNFLAEGYLTLAESYLVSLPYLSWKLVLVGDPMYKVNLKG